MTAAELHEILRNVLDSVEKAWPPGAQTHAASEKDRQQHAREAAAQDAQETKMNSRTQSRSCTWLQRTQKQPHQGNCSSARRTQSPDSVDCSVDKRETRTPRNESMERGDDRATRQRWNESETGCFHGSTGKVSARNADGKIHRKLRKNAEPSKTKSEGKAQHIRQFSVRTPMGAEVLATILRGWLKDRPTETLVQLDLSNVYGSVHRHFALRAVNAQLPEMSPMLAAEWAKGRTFAWVQSDEGWEQIAVDSGARQGAPHSNVALCCALSAATSNNKLAWEHGIAGGQYADDCFYHGPAGTVADNWNDFKEKLQEAGLELQDKKSAAYTLCFEDLNKDERKGFTECLKLCQEQITHRGYLAP